MKNIDTVIFDLGGVLIQWDPRLLYRKIFQTEEEITWFMENVCTHEWNEMQDAGRGLAIATRERVEKFPQYKSQIEAWYGRFPETIGGAVHGTVDILRSIRDSKKFRLYALTNWSAETFPWALQDFEFLHWFEGIVVSGAEKTRKPFPDFYKILTDRYGVHPAQTLFIDDSLRNVEGARHVGWNAIHFQSPEQLRGELKSKSIIV